MSGERRYVRAAVVQMRFHPSVPVPSPSALADPLFDSKREISSLKPDGEDTALPLDRLKVLQGRVRAAYSAQLLKKVLAILDACKAFQTNVVVFPEYSIPPEILAELAERAGEMVIVAGSHFVDDKTLDDGIYGALGDAGDHDDRLGSAVSPVIHAGRLLGLVPKVHVTKLERGFLKAGEGWVPVTLPEGMGGPLGVLICLDFLNRGDEAHWKQIGSLLQPCKLIAAPSLTPSHTLDEAAAKGHEDARRFGRPVLYANDAAHGGSTMFADEDTPQKLSRFPEHVGYLEPGEEGLIVADILVDEVPAGGSTRYDHPITIMPFAVASLVYSGVEPAYAGWVKGFEDAMAWEDKARAKLKAAKVYQAEKARPERRRMPADKASAWRRRMARLDEEIESTSDVERVQKLVREVVLPADVLPLDVVRAALARGASEVLETWVKQVEGGGAFGPVAEQLRKPWIAVDRERANDGWSEAARRAAEGVAREVRGRDQKGIERSVVAILSEKLDDAFEEKASRANEKMKEANFAEGRELYRAILSEVEQVSHSVGEEGVRLKQRIARCKVLIAQASINLQEDEAARAVIADVDPLDLSQVGQATLAEVWAVLGEKDRVEQIISLTSAAQEPNMWTLVRQRLTLRRGEIPADLLDDVAPLQLDAAYLSLRKGDLAEAERYASRAAELRQDWLTTRAAALVRAKALRQSIWEIGPIARVVPTDARARAISWLQMAFVTLRETDVKGNWGSDLDKEEPLFWELIKDGDTLDILSRLIAANEEEDEPKQPAIMAAFRIAQEGRVEEALEGLPEDDHPWRSRLFRVELYQAANQWELALGEALRLCVDQPGRAPIEHTVAELLYKKGDVREAHGHAKRAYEELPGVGYAVLLASIERDIGEHTKAWELIEKLDARGRPKVLRARAILAEDVRENVEAERAWRAYVEKVPKDGNARAQLARLLLRMHKYEEAASVAWILFQDLGDKLDLEDLYTCGFIQRVAGVSRDHIGRAVVVAAKMKERFPFDPRAEHFRLQLLSNIDEPYNEVEPIDTELLEQGPGILTVTSLNEVRDLLQRRAMMMDIVAQLVRAGAIPTATACASSGDPMALIMTSILSSRLAQVGTFCPPVLPMERPIEGGLEGATILVSELELLLLEELDLFSPLREALGARGRLIYFPRTELSIVSDAAHLRARVNPEMLANVRNQIRQLERAAESADELKGLRQYRDQLEDDIDAASRAERLHARLTEPWIQRVQQPPVEGLPPPPEHNDALLRFAWEPLQVLSAVREAMLQNPSWYRLTGDFFGTNVHGAPGYTNKLAWRDMSQLRSFVERYASTKSRDITLPTLVRHLLPSRNEASKRLWKLAELGFPDALRTGDILALAHRYNGFEHPDAKRILDHQEWIAVEPAHVGGEAARQTLAREYAGAIFNSFVGDSGALGDEHSALRDGIVVSLLSRQESIADRSGTTALDQTILFLGSMTLDRPMSQWKPASTSYVPDSTSAGAALWSVVRSWLGNVETRWAAYHRAMRSIWVFADQRGSALIARSLLLIHRDDRGSDGVLPLHSEPWTILDPFGSEHLPRDVFVTYRQPDEKPIRISYEQILEHGSFLLADPAGDIRFGSRQARFHFPVEERNSVIEIQTAIEALFLRLPDDRKRDFAAGISMVQGPSDGVLYQLLHEERWREYARRAVIAPFRMIQDDPYFLRLWPGSRFMSELGHRLTLKALRAVLSEPEELLEPESSLLQVLLQRWQSEDGCWFQGGEDKPARRVDAFHLALLAAEIPGVVAGTSAPSRLLDHEQVFYMSQVAYALDRIEHADEHPIARVAGDVIFLRMAAAQRPLVNLGQGDVDLREILPARLNKLLGAVMEDPKPDTMATAEPALLRVCNEVVQRLALSEGLPLRDELWLTYRLFQWFCLQLDAIAPDVRLHGIRRLVEHAPPMSEPRDRLDPAGFGRARFDHRVATVVHALATMEDFMQSLHLPAQEGPASEKLRSVSSPGLEDKLLRLARDVPQPSQAPHLRSVLDWHAPGNVPDLALIALLGLNGKRFVDLSSELRTRHFEAIPEDMEFLERERPEQSSLIQKMVLTASDHAAALTAPERVLLEQKLRAMKESAATLFMRWAVFVALFSEGALHLEEEARALTLAHINHEAAAILLGRLLVRIASRDPSQVKPVLDAVIHEAPSRGADAVNVVLGALSRVLVHGTPSAQMAAREEIFRLAGEPPFKDDPRTRQVISFFGLRAP